MILDWQEGLFRKGKGPVPYIIIFFLDIYKNFGMKKVVCFFNKISEIMVCFSEEIWDPF